MNDRHGAGEVDVGRLRQTLADGGPVPAPAEWLRDVERHYTMNDQRHNHAPTGPDKSAPQAAAVASEVQFF